MTLLEKKKGLGRELRELFFSDFESELHSARKTWRTPRALTRQRSVSLVSMSLLHSPFPEKAE